MTDLTEKWKNGELEKGYYYTQYNTKIGKPFIEIELRNYLLDLAKVRDADTVKILAPVPSYEEWWKLQNLLGKCYRFLRLTETKVEAIEKVKRGLVKEIDEVLK